MQSPRSVLYVPAHRPRMLAKLRGIPADLLVVDLEDGVPLSGKDTARDNLREAAARDELPDDHWALRVNAVGSQALEADLALADELTPPAVVLPKAEDPAAIARLAERWTGGGAATLLMIETVSGVGHARALAAAHPSVRALLYGSADLRLSLGARPDRDRAWERHTMAEILLAARIAGCAAIDAVTFSFRDDALLEHDARIARNLGFDGKSCIHPAQLETVRRVFSSTPAEVAWAESVLAAWRDQDGDREGVVVVDDEMIEALHLDVARRILEHRPES